MNMLNKRFIVKNDLMELGFGPSQSYSIIKKAKALMVNKGFEFYKSNGVGRVPIEAVEEILGVSLVSDNERELIIHG